MCARSTWMMIIIIRDVILSIKTNLQIRLDDIININIIIIIITSILLRSKRGAHFNEQSKFYFLFHCLVRAVLNWSVSESVTWGCA